MDKNGKRMKTISYSISGIDHTNKLAFLKISKDQKFHYIMFNWHYEPTIEESMKCILSSPFKIMEFETICRGM